MLHEFIRANRADLIARTRAKVAARAVAAPTDDELKSGVPLFLDQLIEALSLAARRPTRSAPCGEPPPCTAATC